MTRGEDTIRSGARRAVSVLWRPLTSLGLALGVASLAFGSTPTLAAFTDAATVSGAQISTDVLAPPTSVSVTQTCVVQPTPALRSPNGSSMTTGASSGTITIAKPSGAVAGDVLLAAIYSFANYSTSSPSPPAGWTPVLTTSSNQGGQFVYTRVVGASEPSSYTWTALLGDASGGIAAFSGVDTSAPVDVAAGLQDSTGGSVTAPSVDTTRANVLLVGIFGLFNTVSQTPPANTSTIWSGVSAGGNSTLAVQESWPTPGATGTRTATGAGAQSIGQLVALQPPVRPHATTTWTPSASSYETGQTFTLLAGAGTQRTASLGIATSSQSDGPLVSGTSYSSNVVASFQQWVSATGTASFTGRSC